MIKLNSKNELYEFLNNVDWNSKKDHDWSSVYFLISFNNYTEMIYFANYNGTWFESPCSLRGFPLQDNELKKYVEEIYSKKYWNEAYQYEQIFQKNNIHYEIDSPQCFPFLPENIEIIQIMSEKDCLNWLIKEEEN